MQEFPEIINETIKCPQCGTIMGEDYSNCPSCMWENPYKNIPKSERNTHTNKYDADISEEQKEEFKKKAISKRNLTDIPESIVNEIISSIKMTTASKFSHHIEYDEIDIVCADCVFGMNAIKGVLVETRDILGGRSGTVQKYLRDARNIAISELKKDAFELGADGIIDVDIEYCPASERGTMFIVKVSGTAVKLY
tara:strand:+ start:142 stop:726 length:585 start_codon:yes stop_codon:yes gene_type:complete